MRKNGILGKFVYVIILVILIIIAIKLYENYKTINFNSFVRTEYKLGVTEFSRDEDVKYSENASYKLSSPTFNDAMFYETIQVVPNTSYKVTCMVKTENVQSQNNTNGGAHISIEDSVEKSKSIKGTNDWQQLEFIFNSKARTEVKVGFRLGGFDDDCTGTAWFSDFKIEKGISDKDNNWHFALFILENTQVNIDGKELSFKVTQQNIEDMNICMERFKSSIRELSGYKMNATYDIINIQKPLTTLSYDEVNGYYVANTDVESLIDDYVQAKDYDHIFAVVRLGDALHQNDIEVKNWIGLGNMQYYGIGFSNIRLPNEDNNYTYKYDTRINLFPEEVLVHEFLHSLEGTCIDYGYDIPELHDNEKYGYKNELLYGLKDWYGVYMRSEITGDKGINQAVYNYKPSHKSDFEYSIEIEAFKEPENMLEEINMIINRIIDIFKIKETINKEQIYESVRF